MKVTTSITKWDVDDLGWNLCETIARNLRLNYDDWIDFKIYDNPNYTDEQKKTIYEMFQDVNIYKQLRFYRGFDKIARIRAYGGEPKLKSSSMAEEVLEYKEWRLPREIPGITKADLELNLVVPGSTNQKKYESNVLTAADDNPYNVADSDAETNLMPMWQPWSRTKKAIEMVKDKNVIWLPSVEAMIDYSCQQCRLRQLKNI